MSKYGDVVTNVVQINDDKIVDSYFPTCSIGVAVTTTVLNLLETAIVNHNFQAASMDVPLNVNLVGKQALTERTLCLLFGKVIINNREVYTWVYKDFRNLWAVCGTYVTEPTEVITARRLCILDPRDNDPKHINYPFKIARDYAMALDQYYTETLIQRRSSGIELL